ncbi:MAG: hypothetical protein FJ358_05225 [Thaumarchaeota archaeon]|nr:hypothetical protein [Nitrososphaerota archaeon]
MHSLRLATIVLILLSVAAYGSFIGFDSLLMEPNSVRIFPRTYTSEIQRNFENETANSLPYGFASHVGGTGSAGVWNIINDDTSPSGPLVIAQTAKDRTPIHFPILIFENGIYSDARISARIKPVDGSVDRAGGIAFKFVDTGNYYVARINALENTIQLYKFLGSRMFPLASIEVLVEVDKWHLLEVETFGPVIRCYYEGKLVIEKEDNSIESGKAGFWTKSDSVTYFDDFIIRK